MVLYPFGLESDFSCSSSFVFFWVDDFTTRTRIFVRLIAKVLALFTLQRTQFVDEVRIRLIPKLIKGISEVFQNYLDICYVLNWFLFLMLPQTSWSFRMILVLKLYIAIATAKLLTISTWCYLFDLYSG